MKNKYSWLLISFSSLLILLFVGFAGIVGFEKYKVYRYSNLGDRALANGNWTMAKIWYVKTLEVDGKNRNVISKLSRSATLFRDPNAVEWWKLHHGLEPESNEIKLGLIDALIRHRRLGEAKVYLDSMTPQSTQVAKYNNLYTAYYIATQNLDEAEGYARASLESQPEDVDLQLNLASILLYQGNPSSMDELNELLNKVSLDKKNLPKMWRVLLGYSTGRRQWRESLGIAEHLAFHPESTWYEKIAYVKLLLKYNNQKVEDFLLTIKNPETVLVEEFCRFLVPEGHGEIMLKWLDVLEESGFESNISFQICRADSYSALNKWDELLAYIEAENWDYFDYYRKMLMARACRALGQELECKGYWNDSIKSVHKSGVAEETRLANLVGSWSEFEPDWLSMMEDMLSDSVHTLWVYNKLQHFYYHKGATRELYRVTKRAASILVDNDSIKNNLIMQSLLLNVDLKEQLEAAKVLYEKYSEKPIPTSTYAFAMYKNGMIKAAYELINVLDDKYYDIAEIAHYGAVICMASEHYDQAADFVEKAKGATLLPEEKELLK